MSIVFFAWKPMPAADANSRSSNGAVSTHGTNATARPAARATAAASARSLSFSTT